MPANQKSISKKVNKQKVESKKELSEEDQFNEFRETLKSTVGKSKFFKKHPPRSLPFFDSTDLKIGQLLGVGGFCDVSEITALHFKLEKSISDKHVNDEEYNDDKRDTVIEADDSQKVELGLEEGILKTTSLQDCSEDDDEDYNMHLSESFDGHDQYSEINDVKKYMSETCMRRNDSRYAIKCLKENLTEKERRYGVLDLAIEAKFLASIIHPNIIKMRGTASGESIRKDFFLVLDKLYHTLDRHIVIWSEIFLTNSSFCGCFGGDKTALNKLMLDRMTVAYDLSSAFLYLHQQGLIYRDIKLENIGFDVRGDVKLFDFGLCKELKKEDKMKDGLYKMTAQTGSLRYMSPEVAKGEHYDQRADVYSFGILLWEILSLKKAFETFAVSDFKQVFNKGYRPPVSGSIPIYTRTLVKECWSDDLNSRPDFSRIANLLRGEMKDLSDSTEITNRTSHMLNRSRTSGHIHRKNLNKAHK
uniref:Protein kinase domain-containing protein n=1 Tax=Eucampia antarctica TaxID=49252 RepID=A0A7S2RHH1_9STRA|eukprot:CAMPEP_0197836288 /NCGR_PEP_ID=MMETSP1437-20131217/28450_1 /TAXON_ID=49252 ORGANISM="Eucampia antarctica, Strain CCMP1452" /NCGR_SAMPLE_ID=MMETSP1437 /ASSEMBLY_ACC=CAM_ASM_001096 /LENGTH=473 /DNA_ID=CAMNT_0043442335 /DNA_START=74 /DNA_END=1495 /DNA_ORIENTATION=+